MQVFCPISIGSALVKRRLRGRKAGEEIVTCLGWDRRGSNAPLAGIMSRCTGCWRSSGARAWDCACGRRNIFEAGDVDGISHETAKFVPAIAVSAWGALIAL